MLIIHFFLIVEEKVRSYQILSPLRKEATFGEQCRRYFQRELWRNCGQTLHHFSGIKDWIILRTGWFPCYCSEIRNEYEIICKLCFQAKGQQLTSEGWGLWPLTSVNVNNGRVWVAPSGREQICHFKICSLHCSPFSSTKNMVRPLRSIGCAFHSMFCRLMTQLRQRDGWRHLRTNFPTGHWPTWENPSDMF